MYWAVIDQETIHTLIHIYDGRGKGSKDAVVGLDTNKIKSIMTELGMITREKDFFVDRPRAINTHSGSVRFDKDGNAAMADPPFHPDYRCRYVVAVHWTPGPVDLTGSVLGKFLHIMFQFFPDKDQYIALIQEIAGAILGELATTGPKKAKCFIMEGSAADNGKSHLIKLLKRLVPDYAHTSVPPHKFAKQEYLISLAGKLLNTSDELSPAALEADIFKAVIDGINELTARDLYKSATKFHSRALHIYACQSLPPFHGGADSGVRTRVVNIKFPFPIPKDQRDDTLVTQIIENEMDLYVRWAVEGASRLIKNRQYTIPPSAEANLEEWLVQTDSVEAFMDARIRRETASCPHNLTKYYLFKAYRDWAQNWHYSKPVEKAKFYERFALRFPEINKPRTGDSRRAVAGIRILDDDYAEGTQAVQERASGEFIIDHTIYESNPDYQWRK